ncbi:MAG: hypothetical protein ACOZDY_08210 [Pseudomonadota bacterium]
MTKTSLIAAAALAALAPAAGLAAGASDVKVFRNSQLIPAQYEVVRRLWIESIPAMFVYPSFATPPEAVQGMQEAAASAGADALINVSCSNLGELRGGDPRLMCYALAIKLK